MSKDICSSCLKALIACLLVFVFLASGPAAFAANEVTDYTADSPPESPTATQWTDDLTVQWVIPAMGNDTLVEFAYKWSTSSSPLTYTEYDVQNYDGTVGAAATPYNAILSSNEIANDNSDMLRYLHIQTVYFPELSPGIFTLSADTVIGPFNIDNVASGTLCLPNPDCNTQLESTRQTQLTITAGVPADLATNGLYLADGVSGEAIPQRPALGVAGDTTTYTLQDTTPGNKTIYAWFKDQASNISTPATADFTLLDPVSIDPYTDTINLSVNDIKGFSVAGTTDGYDWAVINEKDDQGADATGAIAQIITDATDQNGVTVQGLVDGTFQLQATLTGGPEVLTSGTITVEIGTITISFTLQKNANTTSVNAISLAVPVEGLIKASDLYAAVPNIDGLSRWDVDTQSYASYVPGLAFTDFDLVLGEPYFVSVTANGLYDMTAPEGTITFNLQKNANTTSVNAISLPSTKTNLIKASDLYAEIPNIDGLSRWDVDTQSYASYVPGLAFTDFDLTIGEPYFVSVTANGIWQ